MSEIAHIDTRYVIRGVTEAAHDRPGVYERRDGSDSMGCVNTETVNGERVPSCIVGTILAKAVGVENIPMGGDAMAVLRILKRNGFITYTPEAEFLLKTIQLFQDTRTTTWAAILEVLPTLVGNVYRLTWKAIETGARETGY